MDKINIAGLNKAEVLAVLYNNSKLQGLGFLQAQQGNMTVAQAEVLLETTLSFDYLYGKVMKISLKTDRLDPWGYDRDNGYGAAEKAIKHLLDELK